MQERKAAKDRSSTARNRKDHAVLLEVARMIGDDPGLKPTVALRACGIKKDADLRRLRAKFNFRNAELMAEARDSDGAGVPRKTAGGRKAATAKGAAHSNGRGNGGVGWPSAMSATGAVAVHMVPEPRAASRSLALDASRLVKVGYLRKGMSGPSTAMVGMIVPMIGRFAELAATMIGPKAVGAALERQLQLYGLMLQYSPLSAMLKSQAMAAELMLGMMSPRPRSAR